MGQFNAVWQWYVAGAVLGVAAAFAFLLPAPVMIGNWFKKKAGLAMGIAMACSGIGGAVMNPLGGALIQSLGWRPTYAVLALIAAVLVRSAFGSKDYGTLFSYVSIGTSLVGSLGISVYGFLFDRFGSYDPGLMLGIGTGVASAALLLVGMAAAKRLMGAAHVRSGAVQAEEPAF